MFKDLLLRHPAARMKPFHLPPLLLLLLWHAGSTWGSRPPRLNVTDEFVVLISHETYFSVRCEGTEVLHWNWTAMLSPDDDVVTISHENHLNTDYPYVSTLTIEEPYIIDTGFYYCYYSGAGNYATDNNKVAKTYIYIHDNTKGLVESGVDHIKVTTAEKLVIDCRTTLPNITVELWKNSEKSSSQTHTETVI